LKDGDVAVRGEGKSCWDPEKGKTPVSKWGGRHISEKEILGVILKKRGGPKKRRRRRLFPVWGGGRAE